MRFAGVVLASIASAALLACPASLDDRCADGACTRASQDGTNPGDGGEGGALNDAPTDPCVNTPNDPKCINEETAFFVSAKGNDTTGLGTREKPFQSVTSTLGKLTDKKRRIYICEGTYAEDIVLTSAHNSVSLFGGLTCDWSPSQVQPQLGKSALALKIDGASGVAIADLAFKAIDAAGAGNSSIAAFVNGGETTFKHVALTAGKGVKGDPAVSAPFDFSPFTAAALKGNSGESPTNGQEKSVTCPGGDVTVGGAGGASNGADGKPGTPGPDNKGLLSKCTLDGTGGGNGDAGVSPNPKPGVILFGDIAADGWHPGSGPPGDKGGPGQGGGGGAGVGGGNGGSGGAGGCGGAGGAGGQGGGGSIGLLTFQAVVHITEATITTDVPGDGGDGASGQAGQTTGGVRGLAAAAGGCNGGGGGPGGNGAAGGGGAGGVSVGVLYKGRKPDLDQGSSIATKAKGLGGKGPGNKGTDGDNSQVLEIK